MEICNGYRWIGESGANGWTLASMFHNDLGSLSAVSDPQWQVLHCKAGTATAFGTGLYQRQPEAGLLSHKSQLTINWQAPGWHLFGILLRKEMATQSLAMSLGNSQRQTGLCGLAFFTRAIHLFWLHAVYYLWCISCALLWPSNTLPKISNCTWTMASVDCKGPLIWAFLQIFLPNTKEYLSSHFTS